MHFISQLPSQLNLKDFIGGKYFTTEQSTRIMRAILVDREINYEYEMDKVKRFITEAADVFVAQNVISVKVEQEIDDNTKVLIIRFINIVYKARMPIVINDEIVYLPQSLENFEDKEIKTYVEACMRSVKHKESTKADTTLETTRTTCLQPELLKDASGWVVCHETISARKSNASNMYNPKEQITVYN